MGKRKREEKERNGAVSSGSSTKMKRKEQHIQVPSTCPNDDLRGASMTVQIVTGTYEKVVHGVMATISYRSEDILKKRPQVEFANSFLLRPHNAAIRCLALSPSKSRKILLASGSSDQDIQIYQLSTEVPTRSELADSLPPSTLGRIAQSPRNKSLGALEHHGGAINALCFPSRSKLLSAADDCTIAITRTLDWSPLSTIKTPIPKAQGRPSGDTAPVGGTPAGVSDIAVHPSMKLMLSVGKGEKCMRLWNLVTGKKAGVLNFEKSILQGVGEGKWSNGEGRRVRWNSVGEEFVIVLERGCVVYGIDSRPKYQILPLPNTKIHQLRYIPIPNSEDGNEEYMALSTEDGRIMFYRTDLPPTALDGEDGSNEAKILQPVAQLGGTSDGLTGRIKDFEALRLPGALEVVFIACGSDGTIRLWVVEDIELTNGSAPKLFADASHTQDGAERIPDAPEPVGQLIGLYESRNRITCVTAFLMSEQPEQKVLNCTMGIDLDSTKMTKSRQSLS